MERELMLQAIERSEDHLGVRSEESRYMLEHSPEALEAFSSVQSWTGFRRALPAEVYSIAKIAAYRQEDCGSCLQISVNLAAKAGVSRELVQAAVDGHVAELPVELREVYRFAENQANRFDDEKTRERLRARYGDQGLIELALAIASARMYPALKRTMGFAKSCSLIKVAVR